MDLFSEHGKVKNLHVNLDRKTGFLKGYALLEYEFLTEAENAIKNLNNFKLMGRELKVNYAFKNPKTSRNL